MIVPYVNGSEIKITEESYEKNKYTWNCNGEIWERDVIEMFARLVAEKKQGDVVDIGAQSGAFSLLSKLFPESVWHAFEPAPVNAKMLRDNLALNNVSNVQVYEQAVGDRSGSVELKICRTHLGLNTIGDNLVRFPSDNADVVKVPISTLDDLFQDTKIALIKIDTEGAELDILRGGLNVIRRDHPVILMEYNASNLSQCGHSTMELDTLIQSLDYEVVWRGSDDILIAPKTRMTFYIRDHREGSGSYFQSVLSALAVAKMHNQKFVYIPPTYLHHYKSNNVSLSTYLQDWNDIFAFLEPYKETVSEVVDDTDFVYQNKHRNKTVNLLYSKYSLDRHMGHYETLFRDFLPETFHSAIRYRPRANLFEYGKVNICLHLRSVNAEDEVPDDSDYEYYNRDFSEHRCKDKYVQVYLNLLHKLKEMYANKGQEISVHIFSQGEEHEFQPFAQFHLHLNLYAPDTFYFLTKADVLIMAKSSLSYLAALVNPNLKLIRNGFRHALPLSVVRFDDQGNFN